MSGIQSQPSKEGGRSNVMIQIIKEATQEAIKKFKKTWRIKVKILVTSFVGYVGISMALPAVNPTILGVVMGFITGILLCLSD